MNADGTRPAGMDYTLAHKMAGVLARRLGGGYAHFPSSRQAATDVAGKLGLAADCRGGSGAGGDPGDPRVSDEPAGICRLRRPGLSPIYNGRKQRVCCSD